MLTKSSLLVGKYARPPLIRASASSSRLASSKDNLYFSAEAASGSAAAGGFEFFRFGFFESFDSKVRSEPPRAAGKTVTSLTRNFSASASQVLGADVLSPVLSRTMAFRPG